MSVSAAQLAAYAGALAVLVATPGPVVAALIARSATGGVRAAVPLAAGVAVGDVVWPLVGDARDRGGGRGLGRVPDGAALWRGGDAGLDGGEAGREGAGDGAAR